MEEVIDKLRKIRKIYITKHFFERVKEKKLFSSLEKADKITKKAVKSFGIFVYPIMRDDCKYFCLFNSDKDIIVCCPIKLVGKNNFLIQTIYPASDWQIKDYKKLRRKIKQKKLNK